MGHGAPRQLWQVCAARKCSFYSSNRRNRCSNHCFYCSNRRNRLVKSFNLNTFKPGSYGSYSKNSGSYSGSYGYYYKTDIFLLDTLITSAEVLHDLLFTIRKWHRPISSVLSQKKDFERSWMLVVSCGGMEDAIRHLMKHNPKTMYIMYMLIYHICMLA